MTTVNYIIDNNNVKRFTTKRKWLDTYVPSMAERLEKQGFDVVFDRDSDFDLMHIHIPMTMAYRALANNNNGNHKPIIFHGHMTEDTFIVGPRVKYFIRRWFKSIAKKSDVILCPSMSSAEYYRRILPDKDIRQLNYGIDISRYEYCEEDRHAFRQQYGIGEKEIVVSCVGGLTQRKGVSDFCEVAARLPDIRFLWVGGMFYKDRSITSVYNIIARNDKLDLKNVPCNVKFIDYTPDIPSVLSASDIFFFPSRHETQGLALVEAAANGLPLVARDLPVFKEWLTSGVDCLMGSGVDDFESNIRLLAASPDLISRFGEQAHESALRNHDIDKTSQTMATLYEELAG